MWLICLYRIKFPTSFIYNKTRTNELKAKKANVRAKKSYRNVSSMSIANVGRRRAGAYYAHTICMAHNVMQSRNSISLYDSCPLADSIKGGRRFAGRPNTPLPALEFFQQVAFSRINLRLQLKKISLNCVVQRTQQKIEKN